MEMERVRIKAVPVEVYSRIVGYYRPVANWNDGKKEEWRDRRMVDAEALSHPRGMVDGQQGN